MVFWDPTGPESRRRLKMLTGILYPSSGAVDVMGYTPWRRPEKVHGLKIQRSFGQKSQLLWDIPPIDAFYLNKAIYAIPDRDVKRPWRIWWNCWT